MVDANRDGFIDKEDLKDMYASLGWYYNFYLWLAPSFVFEQCSARDLFAC